MQHDYARRRTAVRERMSVAGVDCFLVAGAANMRYLTGFTGSNAAVLLTHDECVLATDGRYVTQIAGECVDIRAVIERDVTRAVASEARGRIAIEAEHITVSQYAAIQPDSVPVTGWVEEVRLVKEPIEERLIRQACAISDEALTACLKLLIEGVTERQFARALDFCMLELGAEAIAFDSIVAFGENSAIPHHQPTSRPLRRGDLMKIDFGARLDGYHSDQTRTFVLGAPAQWQLEIHSVVAQAQAAGRAALGAGASLIDVDANARTVIDAAGYSDSYPHGLGHGVGLEIHEAPMIGARATGILMAGVPVTVEPGIYLPGRGGVRIEDTMWVTESGSEPLTRLSRELHAL